MYPDDLGPARERLRAFLVQYCGGPPEYAQLRGAPRLRVRHAAFRIGPVQRTAWVRRIRVSVEESGLDEAHRRGLWDYLRRAALGLVNTGYR
jgi:hemoglobin